MTFPPLIKTQIYKFPDKIQSYLDVEIYFLQDYVNQVREKVEAIDPLYCIYQGLDGNIKSRCVFRLSKDDASTLIELRLKTDTFYMREA